MDEDDESVVSEMMLGRSIHIKMWGDNEGNDNLPIACWTHGSPGRRAVRE